MTSRITSLFCSHDSENGFIINYSLFCKANVDSHHQYKNLIHLEIIKDEISTNLEKYDLRGVGISVQNNSVIVTSFVGTPIHEDIQELIDEGTVELNEVYLIPRGN